MLSDLGGLVEVLMVMVGVLLSISNYQHLNNFLAAKLYMQENPDDPSGEPVKLEMTRFFNTVEFFMGCLPKKYVCCKRDKN